ncbi:MAG: helix-turn-helix domain-containing protein [Selenomonadaceae bacterium]|nr:helix-turn-helix domain-containing protein [Selenomonadaceae bacterium]
MPKYDKDTDELFVELREDNDIKNYLRRNRAEFVRPLSDYLASLLAQKNLSKQAVIERSGVQREYAYHIFSGLKKNPSRTKILALAFAMGLTLEETQYLLRYAKQSPLYPRNPWDSIIISAIDQRLSVLQTNELLNQLGETVFLG